MKITLFGCKSEPMSSYLKSLGIVKLVYEQLDKNVRSYWNNEIFVIESDQLNSEKDLTDFFLEKYIPTPIVSPWNGGSGFKYGETTITENILKSNCNRLEDYQKVIKKVKEFPYFNLMDKKPDWILNEIKPKAESKKDSMYDKFKKFIDDNGVGPNNDLGVIVNNLGEKEKKEAEKLLKSIHKKIIKGRKSDIITMCRSSLPDNVVSWIDAAIAVDSAGDIITSDILGTGGNNGRMDFSANFMENILKLFTGPKSSEILENALFNKITNSLKELKIGMYDPGLSGGTNQRNIMVKQEDFLFNFWSYILIMEGAMVWSGSVGKRYVTAKSLFQSPFTVEFSAAGIASIHDSENENNQKQYKKELWAPIWEKHFSFVEIKEMFKEGRVIVGKSNARDGLQFAEAVKSMGVDRGISNFRRYAIMVRKGQSSIIVSQEYLNVDDKSKDLKMLSSVEAIYRKIHKIIHKLSGFENLPTSLKRVNFELESALYAYFLKQDESSPQDIQAIIRIIGRSVPIFTKFNPTKENPYRNLSSELIKKGNDGSMEFKIALALSQIPYFKSTILGVSESKDWEIKENRNKSMWWTGTTLYEKMSNSLFDIILRDEMSKEENAINLDLGKVIFNQNEINMIIGDEHNLNGLDQRKVEELFMGFLSSDYRDRDKLANLVNGNERYEGTNINLQWQMIKLLFMSDPIIVNGENIKLFPKKSIVSLLKVGRIKDACSIAYSDLYAKGLYPYKSIIIGNMKLEKVIRLNACLMLRANPKDILNNVMRRENERYIKRN
jgi:CRISPR-associated protein Csx17